MGLLRLETCCFSIRAAYMGALRIMRCTQNCTSLPLPPRPFPGSTHADTHLCESTCVDQRQ